MPPRYVDDEDYVGGFTREDIDGLLEGTTFRVSLPHRRGEQAVPDPS